MPDVSWASVFDICRPPGFNGGIVDEH